MIQKTFFILSFFAAILFWNQPLIASIQDHEEHGHEHIISDSTDHEVDIVEQSEVHAEEHSEGHAEVHAEEHSDDHGSDMSPMFFVIIALIIGAGTRHFFKKSPLPYTVLLLLIGIGVGIVTRLGWFSGGLEAIEKSVQWAGNIDPHLILYVFLPTLIFEAAFAMDVHTFKKSAANAVIMAVPGIILALVLTALIVLGMTKSGLGLHGWGWEIALMFGAVVSATDPVAVVSLLKDLGASKKLGTLIEGESLLNDGTAIVIFMVLFLGMTGQASETPPILEFFRVAVGGTLIGIIVGGVTIMWVRRVFNDALVEISVIVAAAYLTFFIAEHFLHMSGVLGLVALGLAMASVGRTRISPEVEHFLHEFWELAAFIANTLIFLIVGLVISQKTVFTAIDFLILGILYIGIHVVRAIVIAIFYPAMKNIGYGLSKKDSYIVWYGALRGAIGLALALIVAGVDDKYIPAEIKNQFLFLTAGIVTLTLLVNATTIKFLIDKLGLTKIPAAKALMIKNANDHLRESTINQIERLKLDRYLSRADWRKVEQYLPKEPEAFTQDELDIETIAETRRRILETEKSSYWHQFRDGMLSPNAVRKLIDAINEILDEGGLKSLSERKDLEEMWKTPKIWNKLQNYPLVGRFAQRVFFERLAVSYDCARGFIDAQEDALKLIESMHRAISRDEVDKSEEDNLATIEGEINENRIHGQTFLRMLRKNYPEIYTAISTRQAIRSMLNYERHTVERLEKKGRLEYDESKKMVKNIEKRMKKLMDSPPSIDLPKPIELLHEVEWFRELDSKTFSKVVESFQNKIFAVGEKLIKEEGHGDGIFIIARGTVKVTAKEKVLDILGPGSIIGEMALLTGLPRIATVTAESPVTALWMNSVNLQQIMYESKFLQDQFWNIAGRRFIENLLADKEPFDTMRQKQFKKWIKKGEIITPDKNDIINLDKKIAVILTGNVFPDKENELAKTPPEIIREGSFKCGINARIFVCDMSNLEDYS
jgi:Na+:H+ antiporter